MRRIWVGGLSAASAATLLVALSACGGSSTPSVTSTPSGTASGTAATTTPTPTAVVAAPSPTAVVAAPTPTAVSTSAASLIAVAQQVYPACGANGCFTGGTAYTTCDGGFVSPIACPTTPRLQMRFDAICAAWVHDCPDMFGGGQDPLWATESISADPGGTGGVAHVVLGEPGLADWDVDLVIVSSAGQLLVDDIYPTGDAQATSDAYSGNWMPPHGVS